MAQISSGNGFKLDVPKPKGVVGKEEALRMEEEALAKLQREKRHTLSTSAPSSSSAPSPSISKPKPSVAAPQSSPSTQRAEKDLIVFPETKRQAEQDKFRDIDVDKLTNEELEKLLLDENFGANSRVSRPSSLLGFNLSASYPGGHACSSSPFQGGQWTPVLSTPSNSNVSTPTHQPIPVFPSAPFPKPGTFQNGFTPTMSPYMTMSAQQPSFMAFTPIQPASAMVFQQPAVDPEMAKLFDKIASTSEYLKNGKSASTELDSCQAGTASLAPNPPPQQAVAAAAEASSISRFDWLDLDPLTKRKAENEEASPGAEGPTQTGSEPSAGDPWDAVLETKGNNTSNSSSPPPEVKSSQSARSSQRRASTGAAVTRSHSLNIPGTSSQHRNGQEKVKGKGLVKNAALQEPDAQNLEVVAFCQDVAALRSRFPHGDMTTNPGYVLSPVITQRDAGGDNSCSVKVSIEISDSKQPVTFTCDVSSPVELLISQTLCWVHDDLDQVDFSSYLLKVCGREEVLQNKHSLGSHEYVQSCRKWENEITLQLLSTSTMRRDLARTEEDDNSAIDLEKYLGQVERPFRENVTRQGLADYLEGYHNQVNICLQNESTQYKTVDRLVQTLKNLCCALDEVETQTITEAIKRLKHSVNLPQTRSPMMGASSSGQSPNGNSSPVEECMSSLTQAVYDLAKLYLRSFCPPSPSFTSAPIAQPAEGEAVEGRSSKEASGTTDHLQFTLFALHGIPASWISSYEKYFLMCSLTHNGKNLFKPVQSKRVGTYKSFFYHIKWDELINFPIAVAVLPLESILSLTLFGVLNQNASGSPDSNKQRKAPEMLGKVSMPLFDFRRVLARGSRLLCLWTSAQGAAAAVGSAGGRKRIPTERIVLQVDFPNSPVDVLYVEPKEAPSPEPPVEELDPDLRRKLEKICSRASNFGLKRADHQLLWDHRLHVRRDHHSSLPKVLASVPSWDWASIAHIHSLLHHWPPLPPVTALEMLDSKFADTEVRGVAVSWIEKSSDDELADYLPQLVQALKFECHLKNSLVMFLLSRAQGNINITHYLYWLLKDAVQDPAWGQRYERVLGALLCLCGARLRAELHKQTDLVTLLGAVAERVRQAGGSTRQVALQEGLENVQNFFQRNSCRLPLSPSLVAKELNMKACSFFNSNAVPLKLALVNADPLGEEINVMFKVGEDLRQDMLALQMIRIMDRIWLQEGLDLRIVNFKCISTGKDKGMVELVPSSDTLRKIQVEYGVTGSFKDKPLAEWLRKYNPAEDEYEKASENFIYSCAGCCVATYVLGICDRHNDNIMLRSTGHMFHIDFGKFLGHAQMFGSFKRDRAPFVLTSDMAYVINGGERPTSRFQLFVDLCCQAYNLIRKHSGLFLNLLSLMTSSGLPELTGSQDLKYVFDALQPQNTDAEATIFFTRLIESSLGSVATKFNFFIHNLAQLRFSGLPANDEPILSFSPKTYTLKQDGRILHASIFSFQKRYNPDKHYTYVVRLMREGQTEPQFVFRTFDEFQELHNKLSILFPLWKLPG